jgi:6-pyruvoyltetrahydropterin/6-carboxytetrahydropterin synthase
MFRLTREVRFAINDEEGDVACGDVAQLVAAGPSNSYAAFPSLTGLGRYYTLQITLAAPQLDPRSSYLRNIKEIDAVVRERAIPRIAQHVRGRASKGFELPVALFDVLRDAWPDASLEAVRLHLSPFVYIQTSAQEHPMIRLSQRFEFAASHRLHNPALTDEQNRRAFGKCNNPSGHGHNYELQVTLTGKPDANGLLVDMPAFERTVASSVIDRLDHKNLNVDVPEFRDVIPSVENIAKVIYGILRTKLESDLAALASVTVWETSKTWCEYSE